MSTTAHQGRLKLNPTRPTAGDRERRLAWHRIQHGPNAQYVAVRRGDGTVATLDVLDLDQAPIEDYAEVLDVARQVLLAEAEPQWKDRPQSWLAGWYRAIDELRPMIEDVARAHAVDPFHVSTVARIVAEHSSKQGKACWPRVARLQVLAGLSRRVTFRALAVLRQIGLLTTIGQPIIRGGPTPGGLVASSAVRLLTMPAEALRNLRAAVAELRAEEVTGRRRHRQDLTQRQAAEAAPVVDEILGRAPDTTPPPSEPSATPRAPRSAALEAERIAAAAAARAALAAARGS